MTNQLIKPYTDSFVLSQTEGDIISKRAAELNVQFGAVSKSFVLRTILREYSDMKKAQEKK